jgi:SET domain-containing protein
MKALIQHSEANKSTIHGFGAFAKKDLRKGNTIEECPIIVTADEEHNPEQVRAYLFLGQKKNTCMIILGYGCVYNHSDKNNADYYFDKKKNVMVFYAIKKIKKGEEIFTNYGKNYWKTRGRLPK